MQTLSIVVGVVLGAAGLTLSLINWLRLRPDVFVVVWPTFKARSGGWVPERLTVEVHNAGATGVTISAFDVVPIEHRAHGIAHHQHSGLERSFSPVAPPVELPCRLNSYDTVVLVIDATRLRHSYSPEKTEFYAVAEWYGRKRLMGRRAGRSEQARRRRQAGVELSLEARSPGQAAS